MTAKIKNPQTIQSQSIEELKLFYQRLNTDFGLFTEFFLKSYITSASPQFHQEIKYLLPSSQRLILAAPRGFAKSTLSSVFYPLWASLFTKQNDICIISASEGLAIEWLRKIKMELETNEKILRYFGDMRSAKWTEGHIVLRNKVNIRAKGAGGQIRGFRPSCIICDDLETDESVESEDQRKKLKEWLFRACLNTLLPHGQFVVIGTIIHSLAVLADLFSIDNGWEKRKYQAYKDNRQEPGFELWPDLWPHEKLQQRKREIGSTRFSAEYLNNPILDEAAPIKENHIRCWKELPAQYSGVIAVDPAYSEDETADYKVAVLVLIDQNLNRYLAHYIRTHTPTGEFQDAIINLWLRHQGVVTGVGIPNSGVEKAFYESFLKKCEQRKVFPPVVELKNVFTNSQTNVSARNKKSRIIAALQPLFEQGKYYISPEHIEARDELLTIGSSRWDDIVDAMAYSEQIIQPVYFDAGASDDNSPELELANSSYGL